MYSNEPELTLLDLIKAANISQKTLAERLGVSADIIRRWGKGECRPALDKAFHAAQILNCSIERFAMACKINVESSDDTV